MELQEEKGSLAGSSNVSYAKKGFVSLCANLG